MTKLDDRSIRADQPQKRGRLLAGGLALGALLTAAACGNDDDNEVSAQFTGDGCVYSGPTEFEVGDEFEITVSDVTEERTDVGFAVWMVPDGTSVDEVREQGIFVVTGSKARRSLPPKVTEEGTERVLSHTLDAAGTWLVNCYVFASGDYPATTFEVVEKS